MKYLSEEAIRWAVTALKRSAHPFVGITFLACKENKLPVGEAMTFRLDQYTREFMDKHHRLDEESRYYFQPFRSRQYWVNKKYPSSGLQAINTQTFSNVFLHKKSTNVWGFSDSYIDRILHILREIPGHLAGLPLLPISICSERISSGRIRQM